MNLTKDFIISKGFSKAEIYFDKIWEQYRVFYKIKGFDCDILLSPNPQVVGEMTPKQQLEYFSDIELLENHHYGDFGVYVNSFANHLVTIRKRSELIKLMHVCKINLIDK